MKYSEQYNAKRSIILITNLAFMIVFSLTIIFGLLSSKDILTFLNIGSLTTVYLHKILAYLSLILLGIHLAINMNAPIKKIDNNSVYIIIIILGIISFIHVDFYNHLTGNFGFSQVTGNIILNSLEYLCIIAMFTVIANLVYRRIPH